MAMVKKMGVDLKCSVGELVDQVKLIFNLADFRKIRCSEARNQQGGGQRHHRVSPYTIEGLGSNDLL